MHRLDQAILFADLFIAQKRGSPCWGCRYADDCDGAYELDSPEDCTVSARIHPAMPDADAVREFRQIVFGI